MRANGLGCDTVIPKGPANPIATAQTTRKQPIPIQEGLKLTARGLITAVIDETRRQFANGRSVGLARRLSKANILPHLLPAQVREIAC